MDWVLMKPWYHTPELEWHPPAWKTFWRVQLGFTHGVPNTLPMLGLKKYLFLIGWNSHGVNGFSEARKTFSAARALNIEWHRPRQRHRNIELPVQFVREVYCTLWRQNHILSDKTQVCNFFPQLEIPSELCYKYYATACTWEILASKKMQT